MARIVLSPSEMYLATTVACMRMIEDIFANRSDRYGADKKNGFQLHIMGAIGELAVAKFLGVFWNGNLGNLKAPDVGFVQVRSRSEQWHSLILHPADSDDDLFYLVTVQDYVCDVVGYIRGRDGKHPSHWDDPARGRPAFFVKQEYLVLV